MNNDQAYAQGARCGHIEGRHRAGQYVLGEEIELSWEAADNHNLNNPSRTYYWAHGYRKGYKLAAEGSPLPPELEL